MARLYSNNYLAAISGAITDSATSIVVSNVTGLPAIGGADYCLLTIDGGAGKEIVKATAVSGFTLTVVRAQESTTAIAWPNASPIELRATATSYSAGGGGSPGGSTTQVQYNNAGSFGGISGATTDGTTLTLVGPVLGTPASGALTNCTSIPAGQLTGTVSVNRFNSGTSASSSTYLRGDGTWATPSGGGSPGGSTTQIQYNNAGSFAGDTGFTTDGAGVLACDSLTFNGALLQIPVGANAARPAASDGRFRYNSEILAFEGCVSGAWSGNQFITENQIGVGITTRTAAGAYSTTTLAQGDIMYASATNTISALAKNTTATRYICNSGSSNNPAWAQVNLTNGVTGVLPPANGGTVVWSAASGTTQAAAINSGYICTNASQCNVTLPATAAVGARVSVVSQGAGGIKVTANTGQTIKVLAQTTSSAGSITCAAQYDAIEVICVVANTTWVVRNFTSTLLTVA